MVTVMGKDGAGFTNNSDGISAMRIDDEGCDTRLCLGGIG